MNRLKNHTCYLVGSIDKAADFGKGWRQELKPFLKSLGILSIDPTNSVFCGEDDSVAAQKINRYKSEKDWGSATLVGKEIVQRDLRAVDLSSFVIAYIDTDIFMCGATIEIAHAAMQRKPVVVCCKQGKEAVPNFLWGLLKHEMFFDNWDQVKNYIIEADSGDNFNDLQRWKFLDFNKF